MEFGQVGARDEDMNKKDGRLKNEQNPMKGNRQIKHSCRDENGLYIISRKWAGRED